MRERRPHPSLTPCIQPLILGRAGACSTAVRPFCLCKQSRADSPLLRHTHIPTEGTTFLFILRGAVFASKTAQTRPIALEFCPFFLWLPGGIKQVERSALSMTCHEAEHLLVPALKKLRIVSNRLCRINYKARCILILTAPHCLQWCRRLVMELKLSLQLLQACFSLSRLDLEDFLQESLWNEEHNYVLKKKKMNKQKGSQNNSRRSPTDKDPLWVSQRIPASCAHGLRLDGCFCCGIMWSQLAWANSSSPPCPLVPWQPPSHLVSQAGEEEEEEESATRVLKNFPSSTCLFLPAATWLGEGKSCWLCECVVNSSVCVWGGKTWRFREKMAEDVKGAGSGFLHHPISNAQCRSFQRFLPSPGGNVEPWGDRDTDTRHLPSAALGRRRFLSAAQVAKQVQPLKIST